MKIKKSLFIVSAALLLSAATIGTFAYTNDQGLQVDRECTGEAQMIRSRLNQGNGEYAQERAEYKEQFGDGECDGSMAQTRLRANKQLNQDVSE